MSICSIENCYEDAYTEDSELFCEDHHCERENRGKIDAVGDPVDMLGENTEEYLVFVIRHLSRRLDVLEGRV